METLQISPNILRWAADQRSLSLDALVDLLDKPAKHDVLTAGKFSIAEAEKLAKKTHIPFGYFFLDTPPATDTRHCIHNHQRHMMLREAASLLNARPETLMELGKSNLPKLNKIVSLSNTKGA